MHVFIEYFVVTIGIYLIYIPKKTFQYPKLLEYFYFIFNAPPPRAWPHNPFKKWGIKRGQDVNQSVTTTCHWMGQLNIECLTPTQH